MVWVLDIPTRSLGIGRREQAVRSGKLGSLFAIEIECLRSMLLQVQKRG